MSSASGGKDGFTLISVLVLCLILIPVCAVLAQSSRDLAHGVRSDSDEFKRGFLAVGIAEAVAAKVGSDRSLFDRLNGESLTCTLSGHDVTLALRDHDGKIDLNNAASELLIAGFEAAGLDGRRARLLQQFVEASRSNGAGSREISEMVERLSLKHAPFEHIDEVQDILALVDVPAIDMATFFTVGRGVSNIERSTAAQALRIRLGTLVNQGVVFEDNGTFDYVDILVSLRPARGGKAVTIARTYRKISPMGDVIEIQGMQFSAEQHSSAEPSRRDCMTLLGFQEKV